MSTPPESIPKCDPFRAFRVEFINEDGKGNAFEVHALDFMSDKAILKHLLEFLEEQFHEKSKTDDISLDMSKKIKIECYQSKSPIECYVEGGSFALMLNRAMVEFNGFYSKLFPIKPMPWLGQAEAPSTKH